MKEVNKQNSMLCKIIHANPSTFIMNTSKQFEQSGYFKIKKVKKRERARTIDLRTDEILKGLSSEKGSEKAKKMHHLKGNQELTQKSYLNPMRQSIHRSYLHLKPNRVPSSKSRHSLHSSASDFEEGNKLLNFIILL